MRRSLTAVGRLARSISTRAVLIAAIGMPFIASTTHADRLPDAWVKTFDWRLIGPANMGGRITDMAVYEDDPCIWYLAHASGGVLKTTNNGTTFDHLFQHEPVSSIGAIDVADTDPDLVWVGTGEENPRNSSSWGNGVYKSTDGGKTWSHMGLEDSFQVGSVVIHPEDHDTVYVGALGRLWGPNEQRGLFKTTDGGETWEHILKIDDKTGVIEIEMKPDDPDTMLVATYERERDGFDTNDPAKKWGEGSGLYRTTDGGASFDRITEGLPKCTLGRIGLDWYRGDTNIVYAVVESDKIGKVPEDAPVWGFDVEAIEVGAKISGVDEEGPAVDAGLKVGDIIVRLNDETVHSATDLIASFRALKAGDTVGLEISRDRKSETIDLTFGTRPEEQEDPEAANRPAPRRNPRSPYSGTLGGQRENMQDQQGPDGADYGGIYRSDDAGLSWTRINSLNPRPMYYSQVRVDPSDNNYLYVLGTSLYRSKDGGKTFVGDGHRNSGGRAVHVDHHAMWIDPDDGRHMVLGNDGGIYVTFDRMDRWDHYNHVAIGQFYHVTVGPRDNYMIYGGLQDNGSWGGPSRGRRGHGPINEDWISIGGGDGFVCRVDPNDPDQIYFESQNGGLGRSNLRTGERGFMRPRGQRGVRYRFNWKTPFLLSQHNSRIYLTAGNHVFRSLQKGDNLKAISPEITNTDRGSATALAESRFDADVLYVGTDDGALWATRNGRDWSDLYALDQADEAAETEEPQADTPAEAPAEAASEERPAAREGRPGRGEGGGGGGRGGRGGQLLERLMEMDENGDGKIQKSEAPAQMGRMFDRLDGNGDGTIDQKEIAAVRERGGGAAGGRGGRGDAAGGGGRPGGRGGQAGGQPGGRPAAATETEAAAAPATAGDPLSGTWALAIEAEGMPGGGEMTLTLTLGEEGKVTGYLESMMSEGDISEGKFDADAGKLNFVYATDDFALDGTATLVDGALTGSMTMAGGAFSLEFEGKRTSTPVVAGAAAEEPVDDGTRPIGDLVPGTRWVSSIEASRFEESRVYATFDGHRSDDDAPYVFVSENYGETWRSLTGDLPENPGSTRVLREDLTNPDILYLGCEFGLFVSIDRGTTWARFNNDLPTVPIHEVAQHPTRGEIVAGTHGRSLWICDVTPLRQMTQLADMRSTHLFQPNDVNYWRRTSSTGGDIRRFEGENPPSSAQIYYTLGRGNAGVSLRIEDQAGTVVRELDVEGGEGLHRVTWDLRGTPRQAQRGGQRGRRGAPQVSPGTYTVRLQVGDTVQTRSFSVKPDPDYPAAVLWGEEFEAQEALREQLESGGEDED